MQQIALADILAQLAQRFDDNQVQGIDQLVYPSLNQYPDNPALWFYAGLLNNRLGVQSLAAECWEKSLALEPQAMVMGNLGAVLRDSARPELARAVLKRALFLRPGDQPSIVNLIGTYVNEGNPEEGIPYGELLDPNNPSCRQGWFNLALLYLEAGKFEQGFKLYAKGHHEHRDRRQYEDAQELTAENYEQAKGKNLVVFGEQGIGDEMMFATLLEQVVDEFGRVAFDSHARLQGLYATARWADRVECHPTRKGGADWYKPGEWDYYVSLGNIAQFYRNSYESWRPGPHYQADPDMVRFNRDYLEGIAEGRKLVGLAVRGGTMKTSRTYRYIRPDLLDPLFKRDDVMLVNLDYEDMTELVTWAAQTYGPNKLHWYPSINWAWDYHHKAALVQALDCVVTVCQSVAHLSAALGQQTRVLTPSRPAWRYGLRPDPEWYLWPGGHATLHRQVGNDWTPAVASVVESIQ